MTPPLETPSAEPKPSYRSMPIRSPRIEVTHRPDGSLIVQQDYAMPPQHRSLPHLFLQRATEHPDRPFLARREPLPGGGFGGWRYLTYGEAAERAKAVAQAMIDRGLGPGGSVMAISGPSLEHAVFMLGALLARASYAPVSTGYSLLSQDFARLKHVYQVCRPRMIFADDGAAYERALAALPADAFEAVTLRPPRDLPTTAFSELLAARPTSQVQSSLDAITPETVAKTIFTSGSTGAPKGVVQTHGMLTGVIAQHDALYLPDDGDAPPAYLSWMPWSHMGGTNILFCDVINDGGVYYIDDGRPTPGEFHESLRNLREISVRDFSSTPIFYAHLVPAMEADAALRDTFFRKLRYITYGTAALSQDIFDRFQALSIAAAGQRTPVTTKYGSTEAQGVTISPFPLEAMGPIGLPFPGVTLKLAPVGDRLEMRVKGGTVTPGYLGDPEATAKAFDEEGYYRTGDAARFVDPADPSKGLAFDGRVTENFKLSSGTWVAVGALRMALIEAFGIVQDCVIAGQDRDEIAALAWLRASDAAGLAGGERPMAELMAHPKVVEHLSRRLRDYNETAGGSSRRVARMVLLEEPPAGDEIADKGYINQRATLLRRADQVAKLYAAGFAPDVIQG